MIVWLVRVALRAGQSQIESEPNDFKHNNLLGI